MLIPSIEDLPKNCGGWIDCTNTNTHTHTHKHTHTHTYIYIYIYMYIPGAPKLVTVYVYSIVASKLRNLYIIFTYALWNVKQNRTKISKSKHFSIKYYRRHASKVRNFWKKVHYFGSPYLQYPWIPAANIFVDVELTTPLKNAPSIILHRVHGSLWVCFKRFFFLFFLASKTSIKHQSLLESKITISWLSCHSP